MQNKSEKLFGTDGIRGTPGKYPLTDGMIYKIGISLCRYLYYKDKDNQNLKVLIAKDTRLSGSRLETILANAFTSASIDVLSAGIMPTAGLAYLVDKLEADLGIMISASHNKPQDNGIKLFIPGARKISLQDEEWIEDITFSNLIKSKEDFHSKLKGKAHILNKERLYYLDFLKSGLNNFNFTGFKVCLDSNWGATSYFAKELFKSLGFITYSLNDIPQQENANNFGFNDYSQLKDKVRETFSIGFCFDGDGDRVIAIDEEANILDGDAILAILAKYYLDKGLLSNNSIVATTMSNFGLKHSLEKLGIKVILSDVGDRNVLETMLTNKLNLGAEPTGHIILLDKLSTPDGLLCALELLKIIKETNLTLCQLSKVITKIPQVILNIPVRERIELENIASVRDKLKEFNSSLKDEGRIFLRYSRTEDVIRLKVEAKTEVLASGVANCLSLLIDKEIGLKTQSTYV